MFFMIKIGLKHTFLCLTGCLPPLPLATGSRSPILSREHFNSHKKNWSKVHNYAYILEKFNTKLNIQAFGEMHKKLCFFFLRFE